MTKLAVPGFGSVDAGFVEMRNPGQSITCHEHKAAITIQNDCLDVAFIVKLDGGFFPNGDSCDYSCSTSISNVDTGFLLELKGRHLSDTIRQLAKTLVALRTRCSVLYRKAVIVAKGRQMMTAAKFQKQQKTFYRDYHTPLTRISSGAAAQPVLLSGILGSR